MTTKRKIILASGLAVGLMFLILALKFITDTPYRSKLPKYPDAAATSKPLYEQISQAGRKAYLNPSIDNLGELGMVYHSGGYAEKAADCYQLAVNKTLKQGNREWIWNYYLGCLKLAQGESKAAIGNFAKVLEMNPGNYQALYYTGEAYQNLGMISEAENIFKRIAATRSLNISTKNSSQESYIPLQTHAMFRLGRLYLNTNQLDSAGMVFDEIVKRKWTFGPAYRLLGEVYSKQGNQGLGKRYNTRSFDLPEYNPPSDTLLDKITLLSRSDKMLLKQIDEAKRSYNFEWAYQLCTHALAYFPVNKFLLSSMIEVDCINGNIKEAENLVDRHLKLFGDDFDELIKTADLLYSKGLQTQALNYFEKAKKLNPESSRLALWLFDKDKKEDALKLIDEQLKKNPENERILTDAIHIYFSLGEKEKARILLASLKSHYPSSLEGKKCTGMLLSMEGKSNEAMTVYEDLKKKNPKDLSVYKYLANLYLTNKLWDKAILNFKAGLEVYPNDPDFLETLGRLLISCPDPKLRDIDEGREYSERAYLHYRGTPETRLNAARNLATAYAVLGNKQIASGYINITMILAKKLNLPLQEFTSSFALLKKQYDIPD